MKQDKKIKVKLSDIGCTNYWEDFCNKYKYDYYAINNGGGHLEVYITITDYKKWIGLG